MEFWKEVVDNPKIENEKNSQKRQFCHFAYENEFGYGARSRG